MVIGTLSRVFMIFLLVIAALFASNVYVIGVARFGDGLRGFISRIQTYFIRDFLNLLCIKVGPVVQLYLFGMARIVFMWIHQLLLPNTLILVKERVNIQTNFSFGWRCWWVDFFHNRLINFGRLLFWGPFGLRFLFTRNYGGNIGLLLATLRCFLHEFVLARAHLVRLTSALA